MPNVQHVEVFAAENRTQTLFARDVSNAPLNLTGKTIEWSVGRSPWYPNNYNSFFTKAGTIVSASAGSFSVPILPADTQYLRGDYEHMAQTTDGSGLVQIVTLGRFRVTPSLVPV